MFERRKPPGEVTPATEDAGLFKSGLVRLHVELVPFYHHNGRRDLVVKGFVDGDRAIDVVFAGRRSQQAQPLLAHLQRTLSRSRQIASQSGTDLDIDAVRCPALIEGAWRPQFQWD